MPQFDNVILFDLLIIFFLSLFTFLFFLRKNAFYIFFFEKKTNIRLISRRYIFLFRKHNFETMNFSQNFYINKTNNNNTVEITLTNLTLKTFNSQHLNNINKILFKNLTFIK